VSLPHPWILCWVLNSTSQESTPKSMNTCSASLISWPLDVVPQILKLMLLTPLVYNLFLLLRPSISPWTILAFNSPCGLEVHGIALRPPHIFQREVSRRHVLGKDRPKSPSGSRIWPLTVCKGPQFVISPFQSIIHGTTSQLHSDVDTVPPRPGSTQNDAKPFSLLFPVVPNESWSKVINSYKSLSSCLTD
jgi:hypothetical protein